MMRFRGGVPKTSDCRTRIRKPFWIGPASWNAAQNYRCALYPFLISNCALESAVRLLRCEDCKPWKL